MEPVYVPEPLQVNLIHDEAHGYPNFVSLLLSQLSLKEFSKFEV
jgi:hypothetical protein